MAEQVRTPVSKQMIAWIEKNARLIDQMNMGTLTFFVYDFNHRRTRVGMDTDSRRPEETLPPLFPIDVPYG